MSELLSDRLQESTQFAHCGIDLFGPLTIRNYRKELKGYGVMFNCLRCRATHTDFSQSLETDSFTLSLRRYIGRRDNIHLMRSDNGTSFVGTIKGAAKDLPRDGS